MTKLNLPYTMGFFFGQRNLVAKLSEPFMWFEVANFKKKRNK